MYDYNFEERLTQKRLILLLLSLVIPTDKYILQNIYKKKRELEDNDDSYRYPRGPCGWWNGGERNVPSSWKKWYRYCPDDGLKGYANLWPREFSKSLTMIQCLYPNFIMYAKNENADPFGSFYQLNEFHPLRKNNVMRENGISVLNYIVDNWSYICNAYENNMTGWRIKPSLEELMEFMDDHHTPFDILNERVSDFKMRMKYELVSKRKLVELVEYTGVLVDECGFIGF